MSNVTKFIEAAITNPRHPVYQAGGLRHSSILRHYHLNVMTLGAIKPDQWEKDYPQYAQAVTEAIRLCEEDAAVVAAPADEMATLRQQVADLTAKVEALTKPEAVPEPETVETPEPETVETPEPEA